MAGGTGGHIFPALAVADELTQQGWQVRWLGTADRMEAKLVPSRGYDIDFIDVVGLRGHGLKRLLTMPWMLLRSLCQAGGVLRTFQPHVVIGFGGYASGPGGIAAWLYRVPLILHEQNAVVGTTNRILAYFAQRVLQAFPDVFADKHQAELVGNPVRKDILAVAPSELDPILESDNTGIKLLVIGGSLGAKVFNQILPGVLADTMDPQALKIWHQTGHSNDIDWLTEVSAQYHEVGLQQVKVTEFIDNMAEAYQWSDVVICRAGALTVAEIAAAGRAAIFIPFPHAVDDHQTLNALWLVEQQAAILLQQDQLQQPAAIQQCRDFLSSIANIKQMGLNARALAILDATTQVVNCCKKTATYINNG